MALLLSRGIRRPGSSVASGSDCGDSLESLQLPDSPVATTISSVSNLSLAEHSKAPLHHARDGAGAGGAAGAAKNGAAQFLALKSDLARFSAKQGAERANVLRFSVVAFLRRADVFEPPSAQEAAFREGVLEHWGHKLLHDLSRDSLLRSLGANRYVYYEALSGIIARPELAAPGSGALTRLLSSAVALVLVRLAVPSPPASIAAFAGKVLAYAYWYLPDVAPALLFLLRYSPSTLERLRLRCLPDPGAEENLKHYAHHFPAHLSPLVGLLRPITRPCAVADERSDIYGQWKRHWFPESPVFVSFLKHYYSIMARFMPISVDGETLRSSHLASPGLFLLHVAIVGYLDCAVALPTKPMLPPQSGSKTVTRSSSQSTCFDTRSQSVKRLSCDNKKGGALAAPIAATLGTDGHPVDNVSKLKLLACFREILHNDSDCLQYYSVFSRQLDAIIQSVSLGVSLHNMTADIAVCDLVESWILSATLTYPKSAQYAEMSRQTAVDWDFWIRFCDRVLHTNNCFTQVRVFSLLFNIWQKLPLQLLDGPQQRGLSTRRQSSSSSFSLTSSSSRRTDNWSPHSEASTLPSSGQPICATKSPQQRYKNTSKYFQRNIANWLLMESMWTFYFCHWNALVRSYYHRLLCFCLASVGTRGISSSGYSCRDPVIAKLIEYNRDLIGQRLMQFSDYCGHLMTRFKTAVTTSAGSPVPGHRLVIVASKKVEDDHHVYPYDIVDNVAYFNVPQNLPADSRRVVTCPEILAPSPAPEKKSKHKFFNIFMATSKSSSASQQAAKHQLRSVSASPKAEIDLSAIPEPRQLLEKRPRIQHTRNMFALVPDKNEVEFNETDEECVIEKPRLPFEKISGTGLNGHDPCPSSEQSENDMNIFNYGSRSIAEWNNVVKLFEEYAMSEAEVSQHLVEQLELPFMAAEVPWRSV